MKSLSRILHRHGIDSVVPERHDCKHKSGQ